MRTTNHRTTWRKMLGLMGAAALVASALACGGDEATESTATTSIPETVVTDSTTAASVEEETVATGARYDVTVTEVAAPTEQMSDVTLYATEADGLWPVTVLFAGWDSARSTLDPLARALAAEGVVVATTEIGTGDSVLAGEYECSQRLAMLSAWQHGGDPEAPVAVGGHGMGAGMALMASAFDPFYSLEGGLLDCGLEGEDDLPPMDLVIGLGGVWTPAECDGVSGDGLAAKDSRADVSDGFAAYVDWTDSNPSVPILIAHGTADPVCSIDVARGAADELEANGHPVELLVFEGGGHAGGMLFLDDQNDAAAASADPDAEEGREVVAAIVAALSAAVESGPDGQASASMGVETVTDLEYLSTGTQSFELDAYQPEGDGPYPVIVLFHGATAEGKDWNHTSRMAEALAASGLVVFAPTWNAEFATLTGSSWFEAMDRASCALAYAEEHGPDHGGDPSALATFGWSAGAQPAAWLALGHGRPTEGCVADTDPTVPDGAVLIDSEYFLHTTYFQPLFDSELDTARSMVAGFIDPTSWSVAEEANFQLAAAEVQGASERPIDDPSDPASWLTQRDVDGSLTADLEGLGALEDGGIDYIDEARLLQLRLEAAGIDVTYTTLSGDHTGAVGAANDAFLIPAALEATGTG